MSVALVLTWPQNCPKLRVQFLFSSDVLKLGYVSSAVPGKIWPANDLNLQQLKYKTIGYSRSAWLFEFGTHIWTPMPDTSIHGRPGCGLAGRDVVMFGSYYWGDNNATNVFNLDTATWSAAEDYPLPHGGHATVPYGNGTFLSIAGLRGGLVMEWIPATRGWKFRNESALAEAMNMPSAFMVPPEIGPCHC